MKTRIDMTIPTVIILFGLLCIIPLLVATNFKMSPISIWWAGSCTLIILIGLWKIEAFEISGNKLVKTNFMGLFKRTVNLEKLIRYEKKVIDTNHFKNPFNIVTWFSKDKKYLIYRQITILTEGNSKMTFDERTINKEDFNKLYAKIKGYKNRNNN